MKKAMELARDTAIILVPGYVVAYVVALFPGDSDELTFELLMMIFMLLGSTWVGWMFRRSYGYVEVYDFASKRTNFRSTLGAHVLIVAMIITAINVLVAIANGSVSETTSNAPWVLMLVGVLWGVGKNAVYVFFGASIGSWLHRRIVA